ncbi:unnamed protein product [Cochlearia groenlandica]
MANRPEDCNIVFLDTNLDTRFLILSHKDDTVLDFKKKLSNEHKLIFPDNGDIHVTALKIQREQQFYHMSDSVNLFSVFKGITTTDWFVFVDAVKVETPIDLKTKAVAKKTKKRRNRKKHSALSEVVAATTDESREILGEKIDGVVALQEKEVAAEPNDLFGTIQKGYESLEKNGIKTGENQETFDEEKSIGFNSEHVDYRRDAIKEDCENQEKDMVRALQFVDELTTLGDVNDSHEEYGQVQVNVDLHLGPTQQGKNEIDEGNISSSISVGSEPIGEKESRKRKKSSPKDNPKTSRKQKKEKVTASQQQQLDDNEVIALDSDPSTQSN